MTATPIIEVLLTDDGQWNYRLRPSFATTHQYGAILATVVRQLGMLFEIEGGHDATAVAKQIVDAFNREVKEPGSVVTMQMLQ